MIVADQGRGRPLRFLAALAGGWVAFRVVMLWPSAALLDEHVMPSIPSFLPVAQAAPRGDVVPFLRPTTRQVAAIAPPKRMIYATRPAPDPTRVALALLGLVRFGDPQPVAESGAVAPILPGVPRDAPVSGQRPKRLTGSFWLVARGGTGIAPGSVGGQLGGSQAGLRLAYMVDAKHRLALAVRATTPLGPGSRELAGGIEWQPTRLPLRIVAEQRFVVDGGGKGGPALGIVGGFGPRKLGHGVTLEGYGQAGLIRRDRTERYADGALHVAHKLVDLGATRFDLGAGAWGGAQRGAARVDLGPTLAVTLPVANRSLRLSLDWRERVAGQARPGSGVALTLGADF